MEAAVVGPPQPICGRVRRGIAQAVGQHRRPGGDDPVEGPDGRRVREGRRREGAPRPAAVLRPPQRRIPARQPDCPGRPDRHQDPAWRRSRSHHVDHGRTGRAAIDAEDGGDGGGPPPPAVRGAEGERFAPLARTDGSGGGEPVGGDHKTGVAPDPRPLGAAEAVRLPPGPAVRGTPDGDVVSVAGGGVEGNGADRHPDPPAVHHAPYLGVAGQAGDLAADPGGVGRRRHRGVRTGARRGQPGDDQRDRREPPSPLAPAHAPIVPLRRNEAGSASQSEQEEGGDSKAPGAAVATPQSMSTTRPGRTRRLEIATPPNRIGGVFPAQRGFSLARSEGLEPPTF